MYGGHEEKGRTEEEERERERDLCSLTEWSEAKSRSSSVGRPAAAATAVACPSFPLSSVAVCFFSSPKGKHKMDW